MELNIPPYNLFFYWPDSTTFSTFRKTRIPFPFHEDNAGLHDQVCRVRDLLQVGRGAVVPGTHTHGLPVSYVR